MWSSSKEFTSVLDYCNRLNGHILWCLAEPRDAAFVILVKFECCIVSVKDGYVVRVWLWIKGDEGEFIVFSFEKAISSLSEINTFEFVIVTQVVCFWRSTTSTDLCPTVVSEVTFLFVISAVDVYDTSRTHIMATQRNKVFGFVVSCTGRDGSLGPHQSCCRHARNTDIASNHLSAV